MNPNESNCFTCVYSGLPDTVEPCASCDKYFSNYKSPDTVDTNQLVAEEMRKREVAKQKEEEKSPETPDEIEDFVRPTCENCRYSMRRVEEEPCLSCYKYSEFTPIKVSVEGTDANDDVLEPCNTCTHRDNLRCNPPCSHCRQERGIEYPEYEEAEEDEEDVLSPCATCKYGDLPGTVGPCASCFDEGLDHPLNYEEATESGDEGTVGSGYRGNVPKHIVDMFVERMEQAILRSKDECNASPRPCPYCGEIPEVVGETIYPGEEHCYVVCNGAKLLPHSISIHGRSREEAVANWNSFVLTMKNQGK